MRILITPILLIAITFICLADANVLFPIIAVILFAMAALIDKKYPKIYCFHYLSDKIPFGAYAGKTIQYVIENDNNYAAWLFTRTNVRVSDEIERAYEQWIYIAK